jgi:RNA polymerase sporulation-specific sigma factor
MLEHEQTIKYIGLAKAGDENAKAQLLEHNSPLLKSIVRRYRNRGVDYDDLYQLASLGLLKAIKNFDNSFNVRFSTYAVPMIAGEIKRFLRDDGYIKISRALKVLSGKIGGFVEAYKKERSAEPDVETIAREFKIEPQEVVFALDSCRQPVSLFEKTDGGGGDKSPSVIDKIAAEDKSADLLDKLILKDVIKDLDERDKKIILLRYFRDKTQSEISRLMGVSQVQISRLENKILEKMRSCLSE